MGQFRVGEQLWRTGEGARQCLARRGVRMVWHSPGSGAQNARCLAALQPGHSFLPPALGTCVGKPSDLLAFAGIGGRVLFLRWDCSGANPSFALGGAPSTGGPFGWLCLQIVEMPARVRVFVCGAPRSRGERAEGAQVALEAEPSEPSGLNETCDRGPAALA